MACATTLVSFGYLRRQPDGAFLIGPRVMGLAEAFVAGTDVAQEFNALWADGGVAPEETVVLSVLSGNEALYVARAATARGRSASRSTSACACRRISPAAARRCSPGCRPTRCAAASPAGLRPRLTQQGSARHRGAAEGAGADAEARLQHRRRSRARGRLFVRRTGVRRLRRGRRRGRGLHQQGAARQRSRRAATATLALDVAPLSRASAASAWPARGSRRRRCAA